MKQLLFLLFLFLCSQSLAQITGNPQVRDSAALRLDATAMSSLLGNWYLMESQEMIRQQEPKTVERSQLIEFGKGGTIIASQCTDCHQETIGQWELLDAHTLRFTDQRSGNSFLAGPWVVYTLTDQELVLARVLTSSGDWKKLLYFTKDLPPAPSNEKARYCRSCTDDERWCWGDRHEEAKGQWAQLNSLLMEDGRERENRAAILQNLDWLLQHAPCLSPQLYTKALTYYEGLLAAEKNERIKGSYSEKIRKINEQQERYFSRGQ